MNIACDARSLVGPRTGVGTWLTNVMGGLSRRHRDTITLAASRPLELPEPLSDSRVRVLPPPRPAMPGTLWLHTVLPRRLEASDCEVFVAALAVLPRRLQLPAVAMVHDITPRTHPELHTVANRFCFNAYLEESLERARVVVAGSNATERLLEEQFPWLRHRLVHIGYGVDESFSPAAGDDGSRTRQRFSGGRPYLLHLGTIEPRKGLLDLVAAWESLDRRMPDSPDLVLAGSPGWDTGPIFDRIEASPLGRRIHLPGYVAGEDARDLMRHAEAFVLASEVEGFGLPLVEAICCGAPCVASDIPSLREAGGDAALYAPPRDPEALADAVMRVLDAEQVAALRERAAARAAHLRWDPIVDAWHELLSAVVAEA